MKIAVLDQCPREAYSLYRLTRDAVDGALVVPYARVKSLTHAMHLQHFELAVLDTRLCGEPALAALIRELRRDHPRTRLVVHQTTDSAPVSAAAAAQADAYLNLSDSRAHAHRTLLQCLLEPCALTPA